jgi:hypothetical protein
MGFETAGLLGVTRKRRVADGEGTVTPVSEVTVTYSDGTTELLVPGRTRFDPSHTIVKQRPELFTLCAKRDRTSAPATFRAMLARAEREVRRELEDPRALEQARPARTYGRYQLRPRKQQPRSRLR